MILIRIIFLLVATFNLIKAGGDGVISLPELTDKLERLSEHVEEFLMNATSNEKKLKVKVLEAINDFEILVSNIDNVEDREEISQLLDVLKSSLPQPLPSASPSMPPTQSSASSEAPNECIDVTNKLNLLKEVLSTFVSAVSHKDFGAELETAVNHIRELQFDPPLDSENDQQLFKGLADVQQILDLIYKQEHQLNDYKDIVTKLDTIKQQVSVICFQNGIKINGRSGGLDILSVLLGVGGALGGAGGGLGGLVKVVVGIVATVVDVAVGVAGELVGAIPG